MPGFRILHRREIFYSSKSLRSIASGLLDLLAEERGSALLEFSITLPLLVVFVVGIYDFSGAFNQKQKIEQAAQEGAILAAAQPMTDVTGGTSSVPTNPDSLKAVVTAIFNSLAGSGALPNANTGTCMMPPPAPTQPNGGLSWTYTISGCSSAPGTNNLIITINRGCVCAAAPTCTAAPPCASGPPVAIASSVTITFPYNWRFNRVVQLLMPGAAYAATTQLTETATVHNQM